MATNSILPQTSPVETISLAGLGDLIPLTHRGQVIQIERIPSAPPVTTLEPRPILLRRPSGETVLLEVPL